MEKLEFLKNFKFYEDGRLMKGEKKKMTAEEKTLYERAYANLYYERRVRKADKPKRSYKITERVSLKSLISG